MRLPVLVLLVTVPASLAFAQSPEKPKLAINPALVTNVTYVLHDSTRIRRLEEQNDSLRVQLAELDRRLHAIEARSWPLGPGKKAAGPGGDPGEPGGKADGTGNDIWTLLLKLKARVCKNTQDPCP